LLQAAHELLRAVAAQVIALESGDKVHGRRLQATQWLRFSIMKQPMKNSNYMVA
jgi:hypothetical protein